jgi:hypothetical protein
MDVRDGEIVELKKDNVELKSKMSVKDGEIVH